MNKTNQENRYLINIIYTKPFQKEEGQPIEILTSVAIFEYKTYKDAEEAYSKFNRVRFIEFPTKFGNVSFSIICVEMIDTVKYENLIYENVMSEELVEIEDEMEEVEDGE